MKLVNLTPHKITVFSPADWALLGDDNSPIVVEPSGISARCAEAREVIATIPQAQGAWSIPVYRVVYGEISGLPAPESGTVYIVSMRLAQAVPERHDVYFPGEAVRDASGNIVGCIGLSRL